MNDFCSLQSQGAMMIFSDRNPSQYDSLQDYMANICGFAYPSNPLAHPMSDYDYIRKMLMP